MLYVRKHKTSRLRREVLCFILYSSEYDLCYTTYGTRAIFVLEYPEFPITLNAEIR